MATLLVKIILKDKRNSKLSEPGAAVVEVQLVEHPSKRPHEFVATLLQSYYIFNLPEANQWRVNSLVFVVVAVHFWILKKDEPAIFQCISNSVIWVFYNKKIIVS